MESGEIFSVRILRLQDEERFDEMESTGRIRLCAADQSIELFFMRPQRLKAEAGARLRLILMKTGRLVEISMRQGVGPGLVFLLASLIGAGRPAALAQPRTELKIGVIATLSRLGEFQGRQALRGVEIAKDELEKDPGAVKISTIIEDSQADPTRAVSALNKLVAFDRTKFIVGDSWNSTTVPLLPLVNREKVLLVSPAAALTQLSADDYFFRTMPSLSLMMGKLAQFAYGALGLRRIGILFQENPFGIEHKQLFVERFTALGGSITAAEPVEMTSSDVRGQLLRLKKTGPDGILNLHASGPPIGLVVRQGRLLGLSSQWLTHFGAEDVNLWRDYGAEIDHLYYPYPCTAAADGVSPFAWRYQARFGEMPDLIAGNAYDAVMLIASAVKSVGPDPAAVKQHLLSNEDYAGAFGRVRFDGNGDVQRSIIIKDLQRGRGIIMPEAGSACGEPAA